MSWNGGEAWRVSLSAPTWSHPRTDSPLSNRTSPVSGRDRKIMRKGGGRHRQHPLPAPLSLDHAPQFSRVSGSTTAFRDGSIGRGHREFAMTLGDIHGAPGAQQETLLADLTNFDQETQRAAAAPGDWNRGFASLASKPAATPASFCSPRSGPRAAVPTIRLVQHGQPASQPTLISTSACFRQRGARCQS